MSEISNWGRYPRIQAKINEFADLGELMGFLEESKTVIARGNGRCYGDSSLAKNIVSTRKFNKILAFDSDAGRVSCQSGVLFSDLLSLAVPEGWFPGVTPGTKHITVGGAIASDVHGKNHHCEGSFSSFLDEIVVLTGDLEIVKCSRNENPLLFEMTCGGMGLTGIILEATFRLKRIQSSFIRQQTLRVRDLDHAMSLFASRNSRTYSVCWIDGFAKRSSTGCGVFLSGEHATADEVAACHAAEPQDFLAVPRRKAISIPFDVPIGVLNPLVVRVFNRFYYWNAPRTEKSELVDYETFFYPLDRIRHWNRIYGKRGFLQYQFVLPEEKSREGLLVILEHIRRHRVRPFLAVLKLFGEPSGGISFPLKGYTLALDFPARKKVFQLLDALDELVLDFGGRIYLTKDARMQSAAFMKGYQNGRRFVDILRRSGNRLRFQSIQSKRIGLTD